MDKITFTLARIKAHKPCKDGYKELCANLGGIRKYGKDTPITLRQLYESNGHDDTLWCLRTTPKETQNLWRHFAVDAASLVEHLITDERSKNALVVARKYADGKATDVEMAAAWAAAWAAAGDAARAAARAAAGDAAWAAARDAARDAAWAAARDAARDAAGDAARAAARAAAGAAARAAAGDAAGAAAGDAAWAAAGDAAWAAQIELLEQYCKHGKRPENSEHLMKQFYEKRMAEAKF